MFLSDPTTFRRTVAGVAMIAAPLVFVLAELLHGHFENDPGAYLDVISSNTGRWYAAHALVLAALVLAVPAYLGVARLLDEQKSALANLGRLALIPGVIALTAFVGMELVAWQMAQLSTERATMVTLWENTAENAGIAPLILVALLFPVAWLLAGIGLYSARIVPLWSAALVGLAQMVGIVGELAEAPKWLAVAAQVGFAVGLVPIGVRLLRGSADLRAPQTRTASATG
jgi:hypothetical protein